MNSHLLQLLLYASLVSLFFAVLMRRTRAGQIRLGASLWLGMVGGALALAYLMFPFPR